MLSIDSQIKEMLELAEREGLEIVAMKRESHSAKETGQRPVFNEIVEELTAGKYNGILTWAADRIIRNAGDLGRIVDLMDAGHLQEIRTFSQGFRNNPNEKFLLTILGGQAKLENDNRGINVKRGLRTRVEIGLWPGTAPVGYRNQKLMDKKCQVIIDPERAPIIKKMFKKMAYEKWSGRKIHHWLKHEFAFTKLMVCGQCGSGISAEEKYKPRKDGDELKRFNKFQRGVLGIANKGELHTDIDLRTYAKYTLQEGTNEERRELMGCFSSKIKITNGVLTLES